MIEALMLKMGFSGMIAVALTVATIGTATYAKLAITRRDAKIVKLTDQVKDVASQRDALLNANRALTLSVQKQNDTIEGYVRAGQIQQQRADRAVKEANSVKERWEAYTRELEGEPDVQKAYDRIMQKWAKP